ncbi:MAG TPA: methyltransferase domain-containing protein [Patescibacteria group bacterium]|jgi:SAM-dependent methyltransferase|nr:methyltransferase domain-containing protein [Patescibacteria group bacterium]
MAQFDVWEKEYRNPQLITNSDEPQLDFKHFIKWLRKNEHVDLDGLRVLDLGSGTGKNSLFLAERGSDVVGIELSTTAVKIAEARAEERGLFAEFIEGSFGNKFNFPDESFDLILDVVSSNSLSEKERTKYISESARVLKPGGHMFIKTLCKDGDKNAEYLLEHFPGKEKNTYVMPGTNLTERVVSKEDIENLYGKHFKILKLERKHSYTLFQGKSYKRFFWNIYLQK